MPLDSSFHTRDRAQRGGRGQCQTPVLLMASFALHAALGLLFILAHAPAPTLKDTPPPIEMVFDAAPIPPAETLTSTADTSDELSRAVQTTEAEPVSPPPAQPAEPEPLPSPVRPVPEKATPVEDRPAPAPVRNLIPVLAFRPTPPRPRPIPRAFPQLPVAPLSTPAPSAAPPSSPARSTPAPAAPAVTGPTASVVSGVWRGAVAAWMQARKRYPDEARREKAEGQVAVRLTVGRDGQVLDAQVVRGSGSALLDREALSLFRGGHAPPFPAEMIQPRLTMIVSVRYRLEE